MNAVPPRSNKTLAIRRICVLAALTVVVLQGSGSGHMLLVEHSRCVAHGALVHGDAGADHAGHAHAPVGAEGQGATARPDLDFDAGHDHCVLAAERRDLVLAVYGLAADGQLLEVVFADSQPAAPRGSTPATFRTAPKTSPPV